ncbi:hypothetical protein KKA14_19355 [bacterium]|nr:hypothetical protein [bacterium]
MKNLKSINNTVYVLVFATIVFSFCTKFVFGLEMNFKENEEFFEDSDGRAWEQSVRFPIVKGPEAKVVQRINTSIQTLLNRFKCDPKAELLFTSNVKHQNDGVLSLKYNANYMCRTMPNPSGYEGGITFDLSSGRIITLKNELKDTSSYDALSRDVIEKLLPLLKSKVKNYKECNNPHFSGEYYIESNNIVFLEFFSEHYKVFCEVSVSIPLNEIRSYFKADSKLLDNQGSSNIKLLSGEYKNSIRWYRKKNYNKAVQILRPFLESKKYLEYEISNEEALSIINDYAFFLEQNNNFEESIEILRYIVEKKPDRIVAYINLGDAYYGNNEIDKANESYKKYVELMKNSKNEKKIPKRVYNRLK